MGNKIYLIKSYLIIKRLMLYQYHDWKKQINQMILIIEQISQIVYYKNHYRLQLNQNNIYYSEEDFRKDVIGSLRDDGIVIAGSRKGLKIPMSHTELADYLNYSSSRILTMIKRFKEIKIYLNSKSKKRRNQDINMICGFIIKKEKK